MALGMGSLVLSFHFIEWYYWNHKAEEMGEYVTSELYNSQTDPDENINIANQKENMHIIKKLSKQLSGGWRTARPENIK